MKLAHGFCDLNINATDTDLRQTVLKALSLGYQTVAINREVTDAIVPSGGDGNGGGGKKKKKNRGDTATLLPPPKLSLTENDLKHHGITRRPVILTRLTVTYANPDSPFLSKNKEVIRQYDLVAVTTSNDRVLKQILNQSAVDVDILSLNIQDHSQRFSRRLLSQAKDKNIYFELSYGQCLSEGTGRQQTIALAHSLHRLLRSANVVVTSRAIQPRQLRWPYDIINLGRFFGLSEAGAKAAVASAAHNLVYCAAMRRCGVAKCAARVTLLQGEAEDGKDQVKCGKKRKDCVAKYEGLEDARKYLKADNT